MESQNVATESLKRKRGVDTSKLQNSPYYKMRLIVKELRPHVIEVLRTPDFRNCKAATEIRQQLNLLMDLYKEAMTETINPEAAKDEPGTQTASGDMPSEQQKDMKPPENGVSAKPDDKHVFPGDSSLNQQAGEDGVQGTYVVGGSAFGWNFITYPVGKCFYYGRSKEAFRSASAKSE